MGAPSGVVRCAATGRAWRVGRGLSADGGRVLLILPTFNEVENLPLMVPRVLAQGAEIDVLVVDDGSPDGTGKIADDLAAANPGRVPARSPRRALWLVRRDGRRPVSSARRLPALMAASPGTDMVVGSRYIPGGRIEGWGARRRVWSRTPNRIRQVDPTIRVYQASSRDVFGKVTEVPQHEVTRLHPRSP